MSSQSGLLDAMEDASTDDAADNVAHAVPALDQGSDAADSLLHALLAEEDASAVGSKQVRRLESLRWACRCVGAPDAQQPT